VSNVPLLTELYDVENNPNCRRVRERLTELDLCVEEVIPSAPGSKALQKLGSDIILPRLVAQVDGKTVVLQGEIEIIDFLDKQMGIPSPIPKEEWKQSIVQIVDAVTGQMATLLRSGRGNMVSSAAGRNGPEKPLVLYDYAGNQFCRLVREVLTELDLPYTLRSAGKGSPRRQELLELTGNSTQCPYLVDPNTGVATGESADIVKYLYNQYAKWTPPNEILGWISNNVMSLAKPIFKILTPIQAGSMGDSSDLYRQRIEEMKRQVQIETRTSPVVVYTYKLSPFSKEALLLLDSLNITYKEISLGQEWLPGLIAEGGAEKRAALLEITGFSSLPQIFVGGNPIGGLYSGSPGLLPALEDDSFLEMVKASTLTLVADETNAFD
jgi:anaphase-promoting complex subunit 7